MQYKDDFLNLKSSYFLQKIFENMKKNKSLEIIKYSKKLQKRLNLSFNDYKAYSQLYSDIEIELELTDNKYGKFINISKEEKEYYHIYFDNSKEEINRHYLNQNEKVKMIKIIIDYQITSFHKLFSNCKCISSIRFKKFYRTNITDMWGMFCECSSLNELNLSKFKTNNVTDMSHMFEGCMSLNELNLSNFITNKVTNMRQMFNGCVRLRELNVSSFNTANVTDMHSMFNLCSSLRKLNLSNFTSDNVIDMNNMFSGCSSLNEVNLCNFKAVRLIKMFAGCPNDLKLKIIVENEIIET